jgi:tetratricopeptide (TPR) repeat protein
MNQSLNPIRHAKLLERYAVPSMGDYTAVGGEISLILDRLDRNKALSPEDKNFIRDKYLVDLCKFVKILEETGVENFDIFNVARESAQARLRSNRRKELWDKYGIGYIDSSHMRRMIALLEQVERKERVSADDRIWLMENEYNYFPLNCAIHSIEAKWYLSEFEKTQDPWAAVNASSNFRKADTPWEALELLERIEIEEKPNRHLKSALCTTKGGALRDIRRYDEAMKLAKDAHSFDSKSFHPCTLIAAIHYELQEYELGKKWFAMAEERGATRDNIDSEIRSILRRLDKDQKRKLIGHLLKFDSSRYHWLKSQKRRGQQGKRGTYN